jgi:hypothetical protein
MPCSDRPAGLISDAAFAEVLFSFGMPINRKRNLQLAQQIDADQSVLLKALNVAHERGNSRLRFPFSGVFREVFLLKVFSPQRHL